MSDLRPSPVMAAVVLLASLGFAASPLLTPGFGGFEPTQFPVPQDNPPVQPAGYAFAIWGLIYAWLILGAGFGLLARVRAVDWAPMRPALALSLGVGVTWLPVAMVSPLAATVLIWVMLVSALVALARAPVLDRWLGRAPVALYAGWLTAASSVSIGLLLAGYGLTGAVPAALVALALALVIALAVLWLIPDAAEYGAGVIWALVGVLVANWGDTGPVPLLAIMAGIAIGAMALRSSAR
jgi:hypothetical protein